VTSSTAARLPTTFTMLILPPGARDERGFTIIEVLAAMAILLVGILATAMVIDAASHANSRTRQRDAATNIARELIEGARGIPFERVSAPGVITALQAIPGLEDRPGSGYVIRRSGVDYTIAVDVCVMDDPKDGGGPRAATETFCSNSAPPGTQDRNPEDYKRVTTTITWNAGGRGRLVQSGIINNPGSANGPAIRSIRPVGYTAPYVVTGLTPETAPTAVAVDITTSSQPAAINWLLDGSVKQPAPVSTGTTGLTWRFTWNIGPVEGGTLDGAYILSAEAFNQYGVSGPGRQETVTLNRRQPFQPRHVTGGRTGLGTVEIEWTANSERDIIGYQVFRVTPGPAQLVCALAIQKLSTTCVDPSPPDVDLLEYDVYAYDRDTSGQVRAGDNSETLQVTRDNRAPFPPTGLIATRAGDVVTLQWSRPAPEDPDTGDGVEFYRIYRDGQALGNRYDRWFDSRPQVIWEDTNTGGLQHSYSVTAVDKHFAESPFVGPVTR
jgi:prepilin-type N-terminal cleavage/methylation domain-containing protein